MKALALTLALTAAMSQTALAGGLPEPAMEPAVIAADTASSAGDDWVGILMTALVFAAALSK